MAVTKTKTRRVAPAPRRVDDGLEQIPEMDKADAAIYGAIEAIQLHGWNPRGWGGNKEDYRLCILNALNVGATGKPHSNWNRIPAEAIKRVHRILWPDAPVPIKNIAANQIIRWNDTGDARHEGGKRRVLSVLRKALKSGKG